MFRTVILCQSSLVFDTMSDANESTDFANYIDGLDEESIMVIQTSEWKIRIKCRPYLNYSMQMVNEANYLKVLQSIMGAYELYPEIL